MVAQGKFLGRSTSLWVSLVAAFLNALVVLHVVDLDASQVGALNTLALVVIGVLANEENPTTAGTFEATTQAPKVDVTEVKP